LHPRAAESIKLGVGRAAVAELDLATLAEAWQRRWSYAKLPRFPGVRYEISAIVRAAITHAEVLREIRAAGGADLRSARFLTEFHGAPIPEGHKSLSYEMVFGQPERTFTDDEANAVAARVIAHLKATLGATLREV
jgi:phenylalanyl-tRNA synthetase beta chain